MLLYNVVLCSGEVEKSTAIQVESCTGDKYGPSNTVPSQSTAEELPGDGERKRGAEPAKQEERSDQQTTALIKYKEYEQFVWQKYKRKLKASVLDIK